MPASQNVCVFFLFAGDAVGGFFFRGRGILPVGKLCRMEWAVVRLVGFVAGEGEEGGDVDEGDFDFEGGGGEC